MRGETYSIFREPDIGNEITALASVGDGRGFRKTKLMKFSDGVNGNTPASKPASCRFKSDSENQIEEGE